MKYMAELPGKEVRTVDDSQIIDLFFARSELAISELDAKYGKVCHKLANNILGKPVSAFKDAIGIIVGNSATDAMTIRISRRHTISMAKMRLSSKS